MSKSRWGFGKEWAVVALVVAVIIAVAGRGIVERPPWDDGPPEIRLALRPGVTVGVGLRYLADRIDGSDDAVERIIVGDGQVIVRFRATDYRASACRLRRSPERDEVFVQMGVTFDIGTMCA